MNLLSKLMEPRCKHRHTRETHPMCFPLATKTGALLPKVLVFDIETSLIPALLWETGKQYVSSSQLMDTFYVTAWSAKWLFSSEVMSDVLTSHEAKHKSDARILEGIWKLLDSADVVIAHNANGFDIPKLNARFIQNGFNPPMPFKVIDTLTAARSKFAFPSNKLDDLATYLGVENKHHSDLDLWKGCFVGDKEALSEMTVYNRQDVLVLEAVYAKLRPWIKSHPNLGLYVEATGPVCPICASEKLKWGGTYPSNRNIYIAFRCAGCGAVGRGKESILSKDKRKSLVST